MDSARAADPGRAEDPGRQGRPAGLWRNGRYLRYRAARVVSIFGTSLSWIAYPLLVLALGGTAVEAGAVASCAFVSRLACRVPGGWLADRFDRRRLMVITDVLRMLGVASIPLAAARGVLGYPQLLAVAIAEGAADAVFGPAATALLRDVVPPDDLPAALGHTQASRGAATLIGPVVGGLCFELSRMLPFAIDAVSFAASAVLLLGLGRPRVRVEAKARRAAEGGLTAGMRWLWRQPAVLRVALFAGAVNLVSAACQIGVVLTLREHGASAALIGAVLAGSGAGAVAGSLAARRLMRLLSPGRLCALVSCVWAASFAMFAADPAPWLVGCLLTLMSLLSPASGMTLAQITLGQAPRGLLGRVSTAEQLISGSLAPAGPVLAGALLQALGGRVMWLAFAAALLAVAAVTVGPLLPTPRPAPGGALSGAGSGAPQS